MALVFLAVLFVLYSNCIPASCQTFHLGAGLTKTVLNPSGLYDSGMFGYAQTVIVAGPRKLFYISGQSGQDLDGNVIHAGNKTAQMMDAFSNIQIALDAVSANIHNVINVNVMVMNYQYSDLDPPVNLGAIFANFLQSEVTATLIGVQSLALSGMVVEVNAIAVLPVVGGGGGDE